MSEDRNSLRSGLGGVGPGWAQGLMLTAVSVLSMINNMAVIPILPKLIQSYASVPGSRVLAPLVLVIPILGISISSIISGFVIGKVGPRRLLVGGTAVYAVASILPYWLASLPAIIASRAVAGLALGAMLTSSVVLTGEYFTTERRQKWLTIYNAAASGAGVIASVTAGFMGELNWRSPFLLMSIAIPLTIGLILVRPGEPASRPSAGQGGTAAPATGMASYLPIVPILLLTVLSCLLLYPTVFSMGLTIVEKGLGGTRETGIVNAVIAVGSVCGALSLRYLAGVASTHRIALAFLLGCAGTLLITYASSLTVLICGSVVLGLGLGLVPPTLEAWLLEVAAPATRGRAVGYFYTVFWLASFGAPLVGAGLAEAVGGTTASLTYYGVACGVCAVGLSLLGRRRLARLAAG